MELPENLRRQREIEALLPQFEGLVHKTAELTLRTGVEMELEDLKQTYRLKVFQAIKAYDPARAKGLPLRNYVFGAIFNLRLSLQGRRRKGELFIDDIAPASGNQDLVDNFHAHYLSTDHDHVYGYVEDEPPMLPNTLSERERFVLVMLYRRFKQDEIAETIGCTKKEVAAAAKSLRLKLADWKPTAELALPELLIV